MATDPAVHYVTIDRMQFAVEPRTATGADVRRLAHPPIGHDRDLWLETGSGVDVPVFDHTEVELRDGVSFWTAPRAISAGAPKPCQAENEKATDQPLFVGPQRVLCLAPASRRKAIS